jgi:hypothetical protein
VAAPDVSPLGDDTILNSGLHPHLLCGSGARSSANGSLALQALYEIKGPPQVQHPMWDSTELLRMTKKGTTERTGVVDEILVGQKIVNEVVRDDKGRVAKLLTHQKEVEV